MPSIRLVKAALVRLAGPNRAATRVIVFQYNPQSLRHGLQAGPLSSPPSVPAGQGQPWPGWLGGFGGLGGWLGGSAWGTPAAPAAAVSEMFRFTLVLDAADALESGDAVTTGAGLHPILAGLELLLREDARPQADAATVFVWGARRVMPVRLVGLDVHERLFDPALNPLHASARVTLQALDGTEPGAGTLVPALFHQHQLMLQGLAQAADALTPQAAAQAAAALAAGGAG